MTDHKYPWSHNRRYNAYTQYFTKQFGQRVQKISVDAGFSCPNRDGKLAAGGCTYCNNDAFNPSYCNPSKSIDQQVQEGIEFHKIRYRRASNYLVYFQPYSNTYAPLNHLKKLYETALKQPGVIGLVIGTRPDCIDDEKLKYLQELSKQYYIIIEYGVESIYNNTLKRINRWHTFEQSIEAIIKTADYGINTGAHFIFGLPGESRTMMMDSVNEISKLPLTTIKFHQLQIVENTIMAKNFNTNRSDYNLFSFEDYINFIVSFTEKLNPEFIIERFAGEVPPRYLAGPGWDLIRNDQIVIAIEKELEKRDSWQGKYFNSKRSSQKNPR
ncbi:MAG: TIGR01212 family radical SAM protein [Bacteroidetes bacterium]|nr:TIGR01212 family radical SAM protein [Bacteroidota bacterium]MBL6944903.1 TIGR01212 family radical SAM protein [Bacteroidales bacterium]